MSDRVKVSIKNHIAEVVLDRADKMNALDQAGFDQLSAAADEINQASDVRVVILRAEGEHFCAGADKSFLQGAVSDKAEFAKRAKALVANEMTNEFQKPALAWHCMDIPVIACVQGVTYGAGLQVALAADVRIASKTARLSLFEIHWGLIPDMGITQTLPRLVRADIATELVLTGRVVEASEAENIGLVTRVVDNPLEAASQMATLIASKSPDAIRLGKQLMRQSTHLNAADALALEAQLQTELVGSPNQIEAATANLQKRAAVFE